MIIFICCIFFKFLVFKVFMLVLRVFNKLWVLLFNCVGLERICFIVLVVFILILVFFGNIGLGVVIF